TGGRWQSTVRNLGTTHSATTGNTLAAWTSSVTLPTWTSESEGTYKLVVTATDKVGNTATGATTTFKLDNTNPTTATVTTPASGSTYSASTVPASFGGNAADNNGGSGLAAYSTASTSKRGPGNLSGTGFSHDAGKRQHLPSVHCTRELERQCGRQQRRRGPERQQHHLYIAARLGQSLLDGLGLAVRCFQSGRDPRSNKREHRGDMDE